MTNVYIGIGSNLGNREENIVNAIARIGKHKGIYLVTRSGLYVTKPIGGPPQPDYVNCVAELKTEVEPLKLLETFKMIELELGRKPGVRWGPRIIDIDILLYGNRVINEDNLKIPHESMHERIFVLEPLCEISPELIHPVLKKTIFKLLQQFKVCKNY